MTRAPDSRPMASAGDVRAFGGILVLFGAALGLLIVVRPRVLFVAASVLAVGWAASLMSRPEHRRRATTGLGLPILLASIAALAQRAVPPIVLSGLVAAVFLALAAATFTSIAFGRAARDGWMEAVEPMGWSVSRLVLALVYFVVLTPIGLLLRLTGRDPLRLRRAAERSGWHAHTTPSEPGPYFRQF